MTWLVTGGAGYIGAHVVRAFLDEGIPVVALDDLSSGHREFVPETCPFVEGTILDTDLVADAALDEHQVTGVVHLAGFKYAGVSVQRPLHTYDQNVTGTVSLLQAMQDAGVDKIVFSSSAATFGTPDDRPGHRGHPHHARVAVRRVQADRRVAAADQAPRHRAARTRRLRYFNVVGSGTDEVYDTSPHNLFPLVIEALLAGPHPADQRRRLRHP